MLFNSISFLIFFPIVTFLYFVTPYRFRVSLLLFASCVFYMAFIPSYILILAITILIDYFAGIMIEKTEGATRKNYLILSIISTVAVLFVFKYFNFFNTNMQRVSDFLHWNYSMSTLNLILPIGLSFHTFQSLSYVIEVYRGNQKSERNFLVYAVYVMFYPQLVAGPIERPQNLLHQFHEKHDFDYKQVTDGLKLMAWGMFKKVVIADRLASFVDVVYKAPQNYNGVSLCLATLFFSFQIYADFSGYSDIAIGSAQVMGFKLMRNFNRPYFAKNISDFWKRWHISLSTWFRDYVYISLGGSRVPWYKRQINLIIVFLLSGLWHGANWTFVVWGGLHGFYLVFAIWTKPLRENFIKLIRLDRFPLLLKCAQVTITFIIVTFAWIFFRAKSMNDAIYIVTHLFTGFDGNLATKIVKFAELQSTMSFWIGITAVVLLFLVQLVQRKGSIRQMISTKPYYIRWASYFALVIAILFFGYFSNQNFIYFQF